ncbi:MAG: lipoate--protein ligase family protein [Promethearchaeota archaeon]
MGNYNFPSMEWRLIDDDAYPVQVGLAIDEMLVEQLEMGTSSWPATVRFYQFDPPSVVVGSNQDINELDLDFVKEKKLQIGRRITGGGAIIMGVPDVNSQLGVSIIFKDQEDFPKKMGSRYYNLSRPIVKALEILGINATYQSNSDITISGKKITGQALYMTSELTFLHSTITIDYNLNTMLKIMSITPTTENINKYANKFTTIKNILGKSQENNESIMKQVKKALIQGISIEFNANIIQKPLDEQEISKARELYRTKHSNPMYIFTPEGFKAGSCFL